MADHPHSCSQIVISRLRERRSIYVAFSIVLALAVLPLRADDPALRDEISDAWKKRSQYVQNASFAWTSETKTLRGFSDDDLPHRPPPRIRRETISLTIGVNGERDLVRIAKEHIAGRDNVKEFTTHESFDGSEYRIVRRFPDATGKHPTGMILVENEIEWNRNLNPILWSLGKKSAPERSLRIQDFRIVDPASLLNGRPCVRLQNDDRGQTLWLDGERQYSIVRVESRNPQTKNVSVRYDLEHVHDERIGWRPESWTIEGYDPNGNLRSRIAARVTKIELHDELPAETFRLDFPPGTYVEDARRGNEANFIQRPDGARRIILHSERFADYEKLLNTETGEADVVP